MATGETRFLGTLGSYGASYLVLGSLVEWVRIFAVT